MKIINKILILMPISFQHGGAEKALVDLVSYSDNPSVKWMVVFASHGSLVEKIKGLNVETEVLESGRLLNIFKYLLTIFKLVKIIKKEKADLIIGWTGKAHLYSGPSSMIARCKSAWFQMGLPSTSNLSDVITHMIPTKTIFCCSKFVGNEQKKLWPRRDLQSVYPGYSSKEFDQKLLHPLEEIKNKLGIVATKGKIIGIVGRLQTWKGMHTVIKTMPIVLKKHPETVCLVVGGQHPYEKKYQKFLNQLIADLKLYKNVVMVGRQTNIPDWISVMDVFIHASDREPFGIVIPEAMALGKAIIAGDTGGPKEIIKEKSNGLICPFNDHRKMAELIIFYLDHPDIAQRMGENARTDSKLFTDERFSKKMIKSILAITRE